MTRGSPVNFLVLRQRFEHDHARPPVVIRARADHAVGRLVREGPVDILLRFCFQARVVEQVCERNEAVQEVGAALPGFAGAAQPAAVGANIGPGLVQMSAEAVGLDLELAAQPSGGANGAERQRIKSARAQRRAVLHRRGRCASVAAKSERAGMAACEPSKAGLLKEAAAGWCELNAAWQVGNDRQQSNGRAAGYRVFGMRSLRALLVLFAFAVYSRAHSRIAVAGVRCVAEERHRRRNWSLSTPISAMTSTMHSRSRWP